MFQTRKFVAGARVKEQLVRDARYERFQSFRFAALAVDVSVQAGRFGRCTIEADGTVRRPVSDEKIDPFRVVTFEVQVSHSDRVYDFLDRADLDMLLGATALGAATARQLFDEHGNGAFVSTEDVARLLEMFSTLSRR